MVVHQYCWDNACGTV
ncbi:hypothetical protein D030_0135A, partial [Vibrio parahaemolyticus AQ3810]